MRRELDLLAIGWPTHEYAHLKKELYPLCKSWLLINLGYTSHLSKIHDFKRLEEQNGEQEYTKEP